MAATVFVNGRITPEREAVVSVFDHGFLYGEGIYETLRTYHGRPFLFERHMRRLRNSARMLALEVPFADADLASQIRETMGAADLDGGEAYIRVLVTRGVGDLTYDLQATPTPSVIIIVEPQVDPAPEVYERGVRVIIVDVVRNHPETVNPMIKSNNLLNSALAAQQAIRRGGFEGNGFAGGARERWPAWSGDEEIVRGISAKSPRGLSTVRLKADTTYDPRSA